MDKRKEISIIMGIYNCENTLSEAIESILMQTYDNWKFIICDDCSTDHSYEIAEMYKMRYPDKFVLMKNEQNLGLNKTLNKCLRYADGEYIARMDGDDISLPSRFEKEAEILNTYAEYSIVSCYMTTFDSKGDWGCIKTIETPQIVDLPKQVPMFCHAACMIRRDAFIDVGGYTEDKRLLRVEDYHLWFKLYAKGYKGYNIQMPLYKMRDDRDALHRRTIRARLNGIYATFIGYKLLKLPIWMYRYAIRNMFIEILKILLPDSLYELFHRKKLSKY